MLVIEVLCCAATVRVQRGAPAGRGVRGRRGGDVQRVAGARRLRAGRERRAQRAPHQQFPHYAQVYACCTYRGTYTYTRTRKHTHTSPYVLARYAQMYLTCIM